MSDLPNLTATPGEATRVAKVENALNALWIQIAGEEAKDPVMRATTLNLVLFADGDDAATELLTQLSETHPCRAIVVEINPASDLKPDDLMAVPTLYCRPSLGAEARKQVCCEEIVLRVGQNALDRVPAAVQGLLLADLPVYIFWQGEVSATNPLLVGLGEVTDGFIVDSATFGTTAGLSDLASFLNAPHLHGAVYDLNWQRILPWRSTAAQSFDGPQARAVLGTIRDVEVTHKDANVQATLFVSWLASRLGWQLIPADQANTWKGDNGLTVRLQSVADGEAGLQGVRISADTHKYVIELSADTHVIRSSNGHARAFQLLTENTGTLMGAIIDTTGHDAVFEAALPIAADLLKVGTGVVAQQAGRIVVTDGAALAQLAAQYFTFLARQAINQRGIFTVAMSGGSTPKALYSLLAQSPFAGQIDWSKVHIFWGDERNVALDDAESNQRMARETLLNKVPIPSANIHGLKTGTLPAEEVASLYANEIRAFFKADNELPRFDLIWLGLGEDGHTASLFPHSSALTVDDKLLFVANPVQKLNTTRLTLTAGVINNADTVIFLVSGTGKADMLHTLLEEAPRPDDFPSQRIKPTHGTRLVLADRDAAAKLSAGR